MPPVFEVDPYIEQEFGSRLLPLGFRPAGKHRWVRSQKLPIREIFEFEPMRHYARSPRWGFSTGFAPVTKSRKFCRQSTDKNAALDLMINHLDVGGLPHRVPYFGYGPGSVTPEDLQKIRLCAEYSETHAIPDFNRVNTIGDFCEFFLERSKLPPGRLGFDNWAQHNLMLGFVLIVSGNRDEGISKIRDLCAQCSMNFDDTILSEAIQKAVALPTLSKE